MLSDRRQTSSKVPLSMRFEIPSWIDVIKVSILMLCVAIIGCATSRSEIKLSRPTVITPSSTSTGGRVVLIRSVKDERVFEEAPSDPSTPSLGHGGAIQASSEVKARAIGRKRNAYGKALGDVLLEGGQTVEGVIRENLASVLQQAGYKVTNDPTEAGISPLMLDIHIKKFWAWLQPGFWSITVNSNITTDLDIGGIATPTIVSIHVEDSRQIVPDEAWIEIVNRALQDYRSQASAKVASWPR